MGAVTPFSHPSRLAMRALPMWIVRPSTVAVTPSPTITSKSFTSHPGFTPWRSAKFTSADAIGWLALFSTDATLPNQHFSNTIRFNMFQTHNRKWEPKSFHKVALTMQFPSNGFVIITTCISSKDWSVKILNTIIMK